MLRISMAFVAAFALVGTACGSDEAAKKDDPKPTAEEEAPAAAEEPAAEEPKEEEPDLSGYEGSGKVMQATSAAGVAGVQVRELTEGGGYAGCGLKDGDIVVKIDGKAVSEGRAAVTELRTACAKKMGIVVERDGAEATLNN